MHQIPEGLVVELASHLGMSATFETRGQGWRRVFLTSIEDNYSRAMVLCKDGYYSHAKWFIYTNLSEHHYWKYAFNHLIQTGYVINKDTWHMVVEEAKGLAKQKYEEKLRWRRDNPSKRNRQRLHETDGSEFVAQLIPVLCDLRRVINFGNIGVTE